MTTDFTGDDESVAGAPGDEPAAVAPLPLAPDTDPAAGDTASSCGRS